MKKILLLVTLLILVIGCSSVTNEVSDPNKIYRLSDFSEIGWKQKKPFVTDFPQSVVIELPFPFTQLGHLIIL